MFDTDELEKRILEKEYERTINRPSCQELLEIFPEAKPCLKEKLEEIEELAETLSQKIYQKLKVIYQKKKGFKQWLNVEYVKIFEGEDLNCLARKIAKLKWLLIPPNKKKGEITTAMIEKAKAQPIKDVFEEFGFKVDKNFFTKCLFHSPDKTPSLYLANQFYYCFSCGAKGDVISLVMKLRGLNFKQAVIYLQ